MNGAFQLAAKRRFDKCRGIIIIIPAAVSSLEKQRTSEVSSSFPPPGLVFFHYHHHNAALQESARQPSCRHRRDVKPRAKVIGGRHGACGIRRRDVCLKKKKKKRMYRCHVTSVCHSGVEGLGAGSRSSVHCSEQRELYFDIGGKLWPVS